MKYFNMKWTALLFVFFLLAACGGGGGGGTSSNGNGAGDTLTMTVVSNSTGTTTTTYNGNGTDPVFSAGFISSSTNIQMDGSTVSVLIGVEGITQNSYPITQTGSTTVEYIVYSSGTPTTAIYSALSGTITLATVGNVGQPITGSFEAYLVDIAKPINSLNISGTFSATRQF